MAKQTRTRTTMPRRFEIERSRRIPSHTQDVHGPHLPGLEHRLSHVEMSSMGPSRPDRYSNDDARALPRFPSPSPAAGRFESTGRIRTGSWRSRTPFESRESRCRIQAFEWRVDPVNVSFSPPLACVLELPGSVTLEVVAFPHPRFPVTPRTARDCTRCN